MKELSGALLALLLSPWAHAELNGFWDGAERSASIEAPAIELPEIERIREVAAPVTLYNHDDHDDYDSRRRGSFRSCTFRSERYSRPHHARNELAAKEAEFRNRGYRILSSRVVDGGRSNYWYFEIEYEGGLEQVFRSDRYSRPHHAENEMRSKSAQLRNQGIEILSERVINGGRDNYWYYEIRYVQGCR